MPEQECEICNEEVEQENIESTNNHEIVCSSCREKMWDCSDCNDSHTSSEAITETRHGTICESCFSDGDYTCCMDCERVIDLSRDSYFYDSNNSCEHCCPNCASDNECFDCRSCGATMYFDCCGTEYYDDSMCSECYYRSDEEIGNQVSFHGAKCEINALLLKGAYEPASETTMSLFRSFYGRMRDDYAYHSYQLKKDALGPTSDELDEANKWWTGQISIKSEVYKQVAQVFYDMINNDIFLSEHKKYGLYHPLRHLFKKHLKYYDSDARTVVKGEDITMQKLGNDYFNYRIEYVNVEAIATMLEINKTDDGADLKRAINQILGRAYKHKFNQYAKRKATGWTETLEKWKTNASSTKVKIEIGYDPAILQETVDWNSGISCQESSNRTSYAFGFMDMVVNPHLLAILRDDHGDIIGRSLIRLYKANWSDDEEPVSVAPSRLYLTQYSNSKNDVYVGLFKAVDEWAETAFTKHQLIAYRASRHDSSIYSILASSPLMNIKEATDSQVAIQTHYWLPWWRSKPDDSEADFTYYRDEEQRRYIKRVVGANTGWESYAVYEAISNSDYRIVEVKEDDG